MKKKFISIFGKKICYELVNFQHQKPIIVFFHDALGSILQWKDFPDQLSNKLKLPCLIYDRHNHGFSENSPFEPKSNDYLEIEAVMVFPELLKKMSIIQPLILVGHSDGASIAIMANSVLSKQIIANILIAGHVYVEDITIEGIKNTLSIYHETDMKSKLEQFHGKKTEDLFNAWYKIWLSEGFYSWNIENYLNNIQCPTYIMQGDKDEYATLKQVKSIECGLRCTFKSWIVPGANHFLHKKYQDEVIVKISKFLHDHISDF